MTKGRKALGGGNRHSVGFYDNLRDDWRAPAQPEWRPERAVAPAPAATAEQMAAQLAEDPEFADWWSAEERHAWGGASVRRSPRP